MSVFQLATDIQACNALVQQYNPKKLMAELCRVEHHWEERIQLFQALPPLLQDTAGTRLAEMLRSIRFEFPFLNGGDKAWIPETIKFQKALESATADDHKWALEQVLAFKNTLTSEIASMKKTLVERAAEREGKARALAESLGLADGLELVDAEIKACKEAMAKAKKRARVLEQVKDCKMLAEQARACSRIEHEEPQPLRFQTYGVPPSKRFRSA
jgi:hypothetical protein